jgi:hypothetical protein
MPKNKYLVPIICIIVGLVVGGFAVRFYDQRHPKEPVNQPAAGNSQTKASTGNWDLQSRLNSAKDKDGVVDLDKLVDNKIFLNSKNYTNLDGFYQVTCSTDILGFEYKNNPKSYGYPYDCRPLEGEFPFSPPGAGRIGISAKFISDSMPNYDLGHMIRTSGTPLNTVVFKFKTKYFKEGKMAISDINNWPTAVAYMQTGSGDNAIGYNYSLIYPFYTEENKPKIDQKLQWQIFVNMIASTKPLK